MGEDAFSDLVDTMMTDGAVENIQVIPIDLLEGMREKNPGADYVIIGGEHRWRAASLIDPDSSLQAVVSDKADIERVLGEPIDKLTPEQVKAFLIARSVRLNMIKGQLDLKKVAAQYDYAKKALGTERARRNMGLTSDRAFRKVIKDIQKSLPPEAAEALGKMEKDIENEADLSKALETLTHKYGNDLKYGFVFFNFGGQIHLTITMTPEVKGVLDAMVYESRLREVDINAYLSAALKVGWAGVKDRLPNTE